MLKRLHHIDFVVRDLAAAAARYSSILGVEPHGRERLEDRGVELVRFELENVWLVLVQPVGDDGPVKKFLDEHGEGFFHIGLQVEEINAEAERIEDSGIRLVSR